MKSPAWAGVCRLISCSGAVSLSTSVTAVNDIPTLTGLPTDLAVTEDVVSDLDLSGVTLANIDSPGSSFTLTLSVGAGTLAATSGGSVTVAGSGSGTLTLTGTVGNIDAYLNTASAIKYTGVANANGVLLGKGERYCGVFEGWAPDAEEPAGDSVRQDGVISGVAPGCHDQAALGVI